MFEEHLSLTSNNLSSLVLFQNIMICILTIYIVIIFFFIYLAFVKPVNYAVIQIINGRLISAKGVKEYKYLAEAYNMMCERNIISKSKILFEAEHDKLTGFYNRNGYTTIFESINLSKTIYILIDVDLFKEINDSYGHNIGDKALIKVANVIKKQFEKCYLCRIGGDEFVVLAVNCNFDENTLITKIKNMNSELSFKDDSIPAISLSVGVAYGNKYDTTSSIFKKADEALYDVKKSGRCGISIYNDNNN